MFGLLMLACGTALAAAATALVLQARGRVDRRFFAGLIAAAVTLSLFSVVAWAATAVAHVAPLLTWGLVSALALLFALRLYRELQLPPREPR